MWKSFPVLCHASLVCNSGYRPQNPGSALSSQWKRSHVNWMGQQSSLHWCFVSNRNTSIHLRIFTKSKDTFWPQNILCKLSFSFKICDSTIAFFEKLKGWWVLVTCVSLNYFIKITSLKIFLLFSVPKVTCHIKNLRLVWRLRRKWSPRLFSEIIALCHHQHNSPKCKVSHKCALAHTYIPQTLPKCKHNTLHTHTQVWNMHTE